MDTETMLRELKATRNKEKDKFVGTCQTNWHSLLTDVISKIESLNYKCDVMVETTLQLEKENEMLKTMNVQFSNAVDTRNDLITENKQDTSLGEQCRMASKKGVMGLFVDNWDQIDYPKLAEWYEQHKNEQY